jgi:hypothetical protein
VYIFFVCVNVLNSDLVEKGATKNTHPVTLSRCAYVLTRLTALPLFLFKLAPHQATENHFQLITLSKERRIVRRAASAGAKTEACPGAFRNPNALADSHEGGGGANQQQSAHAQGAPQTKGGGVGAVCQSNNTKRP